VSATDVAEAVAGQRSLPDRAVLVTFDDGFRNNLTWAAPELERLGIPALIHVATGYIGQDRLLWTQELDERILSWRYGTLPMPHRPHDAPLPARFAERITLAEHVRSICKRLPNETRICYLDRLRDEPLPLGKSWHRELYAFLSWDEVRSLRQRGFSIGSHTVSHPILTRLTHHNLTAELCDSKATIEREVGGSCPWLAYPNGGPTDVSSEVVSAAEQAGYKVGFTLMEKPNSRFCAPLRMDRVNIAGGLSPAAFEARISGLLSVRTLFRA
jgi:peptidoglycan/xylan/chitin deacetylase (PgdA/CDA1 family)